MRLTSFTDYGLRALMRIASEPERAHSTAEIAAEFGISRHHLTKAMATLSSAGILRTRRGHDGGAVLARPASEIRLGEVIRLLEEGSAIVECFRADGGACRISPHCRLKGFLRDGEQAFLSALNSRTLADCALPSHQDATAREDTRR